MSKKKNAFSFFLDEYVQQERDKGRSISKRLAVEECSKMWKALSEGEKQFYIDCAKSYKSEQSYMKQEKINLEMEDGKKFKSGMVLKYLTEFVNSEKAVKNHKFYLIHCNYYCRTEAGVYYPAELAISQFSLMNGVIRTYHTLIDPGTLPLGYAYEGKRLSEDIHGLPLPPYKEGEKNFHKIFTDILGFMKSSKTEEGAYAPFFTLENQITPVTNILSKLTLFEYDEDPELFSVYPLYRMFFWLKNKCAETCDEVGFPVLANAITEIEKDVFRYCSGISCEFHKDSDDHYHNCSLSIVQRLVYIVCDHCCSHVNIELIPGKHVHAKAVSRKQASPKNDRSKNSWQTRSRISDSEEEVDDVFPVSSYASSIPESSYCPSDSAVGNRDRKELEKVIEKVNLESESRKDAASQHCDNDGSSSEDEHTITITLGRGKRLENIIKSVGLPKH